MECWAFPTHYSNSDVMLVMVEEHSDSLLAQELAAIVGLTVKTAEPLVRYTSMKIGGPADYFIEVENDSALSRVLVLLDRRRISFCLLGNGSNVLVSDRGVRGAVIRLAGDFKRVQWREAGDTVQVKVGAAYPVTQLVRQATRRGYAGLEFAEGIPGTVGGALFMNAGAYGSEFEKVVEEVDAMSAQGEPVCFSREQMNFSYRDAHLPAGTVVLEVRMHLAKAETAIVDSKLRELVGRRKSSQPSGLPNSGSMFRNPLGDYAGRLIEAAGLKGKRIGQAQIAERHANFIVNLGGAKAIEVRQLMELAKKEVSRQFGIELVAEVKLLGEWDAN